MLDMLMLVILRDNSFSAIGKIYHRLTAFSILFPNTFPLSNGDREKMAHPEASGKAIVTELLN